MSPPGSGCVVVAEMSTAGCLISSDYIESVLKMAAEYSNVIGLVCQRKLSDREDLIYMTPGVCVCVSMCLCVIIFIVLILKVSILKLRVIRLDSNTTVQKR